MRSKKDSLGDRIKAYEEVYEYKLTPNSCLFIRVDGKAFHTFTAKMEKPFDRNLMNAMVMAAEFASRQMMGFKLAYVQSDECTFMLTDFDTHDTQGWFDYSLNKVVSIAASAFTAYFNRYYYQEEGMQPAMFDARAFIVPKEDAPNVFVWRQKDWERNSLQMLARSLYSQKQLHGKKNAELHEMIYQKGQNWANLEPIQKNGTFIFPDHIVEYKKMTYEDIYKVCFSEA